MSHNNDFRTSALLDYANQFVYRPVGFGTTGGSGGPRIHVDSLGALNDALRGDEAKEVILTQSLSGDGFIDVGSNTTFEGAREVTLDGIVVRVRNVKNIRISKLRIVNVLAASSMYHRKAIVVWGSVNVWLDSIDLSGNERAFDSLIDLTTSTNVTISNSYICAVIRHAGLGPRVP